MAPRSPLHQGWIRVEHDRPPSITVTLPTPSQSPSPPRTQLPAHPISIVRTTNSSPRKSASARPAPRPAPIPQDDPILSPLDSLRYRITQQKAYISLQAELAAALDATLTARTALSQAEEENDQLHLRISSLQAQLENHRHLQLECKQNHSDSPSKTSQSRNGSISRKRKSTTPLEMENARLRGKLAQCREVISGLVEWGAALGDENGVLREQIGEGGSIWRPDVSDLLDFFDD